MAIDAGDTAWVLIATALVMLMTPGLALFYGGMVRAKNVLATLVACLAILALVSVQWAILGYSLAFGPTVNGIIGNLDFAFLNGVSLADPNEAYAGTIPHGAFMLFQMMFAVITPALILGAMAERVSLKGIALFTVLWATLVYDPIAHWVWGVGGWLREFGALDFAGGLVVHVSSGVAALACAIYLGKRRGLGERAMSGHNLTLTLLGAGLLWFGWFGFNAGSALAANGLAASAFLATHLAAAAALVSWAALEWLVKGKPTGLGAASGAIAGLVAITPAAGFVGPAPALAIGAGVGIVCFLGVNLKHRLGYDDALDAFGVHGIGGVFGAIATGLFASVAVNAAGKNGLLVDPATGVALMGAQLLGVAVVVAYTLIVTFGLLWIVDRAVGLRVTEEHEDVGLDLSQHGEPGYAAELPEAAKDAGLAAASPIALLFATGGARRDGK